MQSLDRPKRADPEGQSLIPETHVGHAGCLQFPKDSHLLGHDPIDDEIGADEVHVACLESRLDMPAFPWEIEAAEREGVRLHTALAPQEFTSKNGRVSGIEFKRVISTQLDSDGRISWKLLEGSGSEFSVETDNVVVAIGQVPAGEGKPSKSLKSNRTGGITVDSDTLATGISGVFAAGDISATGGTVTEAMAAGRKAAAAIDGYLSGGAIPAAEESREIIWIIVKLCSIKALIFQIAFQIPIRTGKNRIVL